MFLASTAFEGGKVLANWISAYDEREPAEKHSLKVMIYYIITFSRRYDLMGIYSDSKRVVSIQISSTLFGVRTFSTLTLWLSSDFVGACKIQRAQSADRDDYSSS